MALVQRIGAALPTSLSLEALLRPARSLAGRRIRAMRCAARRGGRRTHWLVHFLLATCLPDWLVCAASHLLESPPSQSHRILQDKANRSDPNRVGGPTNNLLSGGGLGTGIAKSDGSFACVVGSATPARQARRLPSRLWTAAAAMAGRMPCCCPPAVCHSPSHSHSGCLLRIVLRSLSRTHNRTGNQDRHATPRLALSRTTPPLVPQLLSWQVVGCRLVLSAWTYALCMPTFSFTSCRTILGAFSAIAEIAERMGLTATVKDAANEFYKDVGEPSLPAAVSARAREPHPSKRMNQTRPLALTCS